MFRLHIRDEDEDYKSCYFPDYEECKEAFDGLCKSSMFEEIWITDENGETVIKNGWILIIFYRRFY